MTLGSVLNDTIVEDVENKRTRSHAINRSLWIFRVLLIIFTKGHLTMKALVLDGEFDPRPDYPVSDEEKRTHIARRGSNVWRHTRLEVKKVPDPEVGPEDVLIQIRACGV